MRFQLFALSVIALLGTDGAAWAGQYDGNWAGTAAPCSVRAKGANVTLTVKDTAVSGTAAGGRGTGAITATIAPDGSFTGYSVGDRGQVPITGKFAGDTVQFTLSGGCSESGTAQRVK